MRACLKYTGRSFHAVSRSTQPTACLVGRYALRRFHAETTRDPTSSVNEDEIRFFSNLSAQWWDEKGEFGLLHKMNPVRVRFIRDKVVEAARDDGNEVLDNRPKVLEGLDVLDVGCGGGLLSESLARLGARTTGIDASSSNISIASTHASQDPFLRNPDMSSLSYRHTTAEKLVSEKQQFDLVCSMEVLEHVENPSAFLKSCATLVKPGGHLFLSTIARTPLAYFLTIFAAEKLLRLVEPGTHAFNKYVNPDELLDFFRTPLAAGERPWISALHQGQPRRWEAEVRGMAFTPWTGTWELAPPNALGSTECNYLFWARKPRTLP